jgi:hypothetical protein
MGGLIVVDLLQKWWEYGIEHFLSGLYVVDRAPLILVQLAGEEPLTVGPDLSSAERVLSLPLRLELSVDPSNALQGHAVFAQLAGDEELDEVQEADRQVTIDGVVVAAEDGPCARPGVATMEPFLDPGSPEPGQFRGFGQVIDPFAKDLGLYRHLPIRCPRAIGENITHEVLSVCCVVH